MSAATDKTRVSVHGCLVQWEGKGILLTGDSGVGKTICALEISRRGGAWIADDIAVLKRLPDHTVSGRAHERIANLLHLRGTGIVDVRSLHPIPVVDETRVDIIIELTKKLEKDDKKGLATARLREFLDAEIPFARVDVSADTGLTVDTILNHVRFHIGGR